MERQDRASIQKFLNSWKVAHARVVINLELQDRPGASSDDGTELIRDLCDQADLKYLGIGLQYAGDRPTQSIVYVIEGEEFKTYTFPQVYKLARTKVPHPEAS